MTGALGAGLLVAVSSDACLGFPAAHFAPTGVLVQALASDDPRTKTLKLILSFLPRSTPARLSRFGLATDHPEGKKRQGAVHQRRHHALRPPPPAAGVQDFEHERADSAKEVS